MKYGKRYSIIDLAESLKPGADLRLAKFERGLSGMMAELLPEKSGLAGVVMPTIKFARDLEVGAIDGGQAISSTTVLPVAKACRPATVMEDAGARVVNLNSTSAATLPVFDGSLTTAVWISEGGASPSFSNLTVKSVSSTPKCCAARIAYSRRLMASVSDRAAFENALLAELRRAIKTQIEEKFFSGTGSTNQPLGILNTPGVQTKSFGAALGTHSELTSMIEMLVDANGDLATSRFLMHSSDFAKLLDQQVTTDGGTTTISFEGDRYRIAGVPVHQTTAATEGKVVLADMAKISLIFFGAPSLLSDGFSGGKSTYGTTELIVMNWLDSAITDAKTIVVGSA